MNSAKELHIALKKVQPGDVISISPGRYKMGNSFATGSDGTAAKPIIMRCSSQKHYAKLIVDGKIGFRVKSKFWRISGIHIEGSIKNTQATVFMDGPNGCSDVLLSDCKISGSALHGMKAARTREKAAHNITLAQIELFNIAQTGFDLVSGDNWILRNCYVHNYGLSKGVSYGIFLKGGGKNGLIQGCYVDGTSTNTTVGISFGGGLTGKQWLPLVDGKVAPEHFNGIAQNNIVTNTRDVAYHSNNASDCKFYHNLAWNCRNFQRQKSYKPDPLLIHNIIPGKLRGAHEKSLANFTGENGPLFLNPSKSDFRYTKEAYAIFKKAFNKKVIQINFFGNKKTEDIIGPFISTEKTTPTPLRSARK
ncbi:MAG: right-handed parallel beta-helix repeat-containing protein [Lentisphaeraceae bacterium]|nr:right-handed parallel beta-helix repeat-containing protein [Lentisphaeraceae bacterium]